MSDSNSNKQEEQLARFESLLHQWAGQWFPESRRTELKRAFWRAVEKYSGNGDPDSFLEILESNPSETLKESVIQEILVGETYFFRDQALWTNLEQIIIPDIVSHKIGSKNMRIWSAGCSTGEEPYSLALVLNHSVTAIDSWRISILATDISEISLNKARLGLYGQRAIREIDEQRWKNFYYRYERDIQMKESLKKLITFQQGNLSELNFPDLKTMGSDLIICRNVLIYFDRELVRKVITQFGRCLSPNGWLVLAPTEVPLEPPPGLKVQLLPHNCMVLRPTTAQDSPFIGSHNDIFSISKGQTPAPAPRSARLSSATRDSLKRLSSRPSEKGQNAPSRPASPSNSAAKPTLSAIEYMDKYLQAKAEADRGKLHEALASAIKCTKLSSTDARGWILLGTIQEELRLYNKAYESFKRAIYLDNSLAVAHLFLGRVQYRLGQFDTAATLNYFRKITDSSSPEELLPEGGGLTVREGRALADQLTRLCQESW